MGSPATIQWSVAFGFSLPYPPVAFEGPLLEAFKKMNVMTGSKKIRSRQKIKKIKITIRG